MPKVGIVMGSDSDLKVMSKAAATLEKFGIDYEMTIISAHRMPDVFFDWAKAAEGKGIKVIIAGAGMAAHLPGMCAALFPMPVIGIPMSGKNLEGMDALYSIVQMPPGIPVATVAIDGGMNAAILAAKMLAMSDPELLEKLKAYSAEMKDTVQAKADRLAEVGYEEYLNNSSSASPYSGDLLSQWVNLSFYNMLGTDYGTDYTEYIDSDDFEKLDAEKILSNVPDDLLPTEMTEKNK